mgnify:CR=1 FL=1
MLGILLVVAACVSLATPLVFQIIIGKTRIVQAEIVSAKALVNHYSTTDPQAILREAQTFALRRHRLRFATQLTFRFTRDTYKTDSDQSMRSSFDGSPDVTKTAPTPPLMATHVVFPLWAPSILLISLFVGPILCGWRAKLRSHKEIVCANCSYCLRANESGICPECGTPIPEEEKRSIAQATTNT